MYGLFCSFTSVFTASNLLSPYSLHYSPSPHIGAIRDFHTQLNSTRFFALPFRIIPSTSLRSEYPFKFQKWNFQTISLFRVPYIQRSLFKSLIHYALYSGLRTVPYSRPLMHKTPYSELPVTWLLIQSSLYTRLFIQGYVRFLIQGLLCTRVLIQSSLHTRLFIQGFLYSRAL